MLTAAKPCYYQHKKVLDEEPNIPIIDDIIVLYRSTYEQLQEEFSKCECCEDQAEIIKTFY